MESKKLITEKCKECSVGPRYCVNHTLYKDEPWRCPSDIKPEDLIGYFDKADTDSD